MGGVTANTLSLVSPGWDHFSRRSLLTLGSHVWAVGAHLL